MNNKWFFQFVEFFSPWFYFVFTFYWNIIALRCCGSFYCTTKWIPYMDTCMPSSCASLPLPAPIPPLRVITARSWAPCAAQQLPTVRFTRDSVWMSVPLSQRIPFSSSPSMSTRLILHLCVSIPDPQTCWERILICLKNLPQNSDLKLLWASELLITHI